MIITGVVRVVLISTRWEASVVLDVEVGGFVVVVEIAPISFLWLSTETNIGSADVVDELNLGMSRSASEECNKNGTAVIFGNRALILGIT